MKNPRVSVVIPAYESERRIDMTLGQLRRQTFTDFEVVVVNDGSKDDTSAAVRRLMRDDSRIRLIEQANRGIAGARNRGVEAARGELLAFLDDDDLWHPRKLELQVARLDAARDASVVSCFSALVDTDGRLIGWRFGGVTEGDVYREMLEWDMISGGSVVLAERDAVEAAGGFDAELPDRADWELWIRLSRRHRFTCVPHTLVGYTRRPGSMSHSHERMIGYGRGVLAKACREDPSIGDAAHRAFLARDLFAMTCFALIDGEQREAWHYLMRSLRAGPSIVLSRPRRWGIIAMLTLATTLPAAAYQRVIAAMSRRAFGLEPGASFDSLP